jgi:hypothetical protein
MNKRIVTTALSLAAVIGLGLFLLAGASTKVKTKAFYAESRAVLLAIKTPVRPGGSDHAMICTLPSGDWYAVRLEHACCTGAGFDAVMIKDSQGQFYTAEKNYCGYEGFQHGDTVKDLSELKKTLIRDGYRRE